MSRRYEMPRTSPVSVPAGWRVVYRVRFFCDADRVEPATEIGSNDYGTYAEALACMRRERSKRRPREKRVIPLDHPFLFRMATRLEVVMLAPTVLPYQSVLKRRGKMLAEFYSRVPPPPRRYRTPDQATCLQR